MHLALKSYGTIFHNSARTVCLVIQGLGCGPVDSNVCDECAADNTQYGYKLQVGSRRRPRAGPADSLSGSEHNAWETVHGKYWNVEAPLPPLQKWGGIKYEGKYLTILTSCAIIKVCC